MIDRPANAKSRPTLEAYSELQYAFDFFNREIFDNDLPNVLILWTLRQNVGGHFGPDRWKDRSGEKASEIAMNPIYMEMLGFTHAMQTLVHEMCHLWQHHNGTPSRTGYHNKEWAAKMEEIGLMPSNTGKPGGKKTGQKMSDYPIEGGIFLEALAKLVGENFELTWATALLSAVKDATDTSSEDGESEEGEEEKPKKKDRVKFTCEECNCNAWAKPTAEIGCWQCQVQMVPAE